MGGEKGELYRVNSFYSIVHPINTIYWFYDTYKENCWAEYGQNWQLCHRKDEGLFGGGDNLIKIICLYIKVV